MNPNNQKRRGAATVFGIAVVGLGVFGWMLTSKGKGSPGMGRGSGPLTFHKDVAPIVYEKCSYCHRPGEAAPFSLLSYADVAQRVKKIQEVTARRLMPPWLAEHGY